MLFNSFLGNFYFSIFLVVFVIFCSGWFSSYYFRNQLLLSLLSLEVVLLGIFLGFVFLLTCMDKSVSVSFYLLVLGACEASLGLSLLVSLVRVSGNDVLSLSSFLNC